VTFPDRQKLLRQLGRQRQSTALLYVTGDRPGWESQISRDTVDLFVDHLEVIGHSDTVSLVLYTNGGDTLAAWNIVNLFRQFCDKLELIVPSKALSAGTLIALGADRIIMTRQATLGPIDPSVTGPLNPMIPGAPQARAAVSVEAVKGYLEIATSELAIKDDAALASVLNTLAGQIHPLVLGQIFRSRAQIRDLARRLITHQVQESDRIDEIVNFLCAESGSHDYTVNAREARELGLTVETPPDQVYRTIRALHMDFRADLRLNEPHDPHAMLGTNTETTYTVRRALVESVRGGSHTFVSEGRLRKVQVQVAVPGMPGPTALPQEQITDDRTFEGWRKEQ
jgi:Serine dehydrogenase proteinase